MPSIAPKPVLVRSNNQGNGAEWVGFREQQAPLFPEVLEKSDLPPGAMRVVLVAKKAFEQQDYYLEALQEIQEWLESLAEEEEKEKRKSVGFYIPFDDPYAL